MYFDYYMESICTTKETKNNNSYIYMINYTVNIATTHLLYHIYNMLSTRFTCKTEIVRKKKNDHIETIKRSKKKKKKTKTNK